MTTTALVASGALAATVAVSTTVAHAAPGVDPDVLLSVEKLYDGTGYGTEAQTFVTPANGFSPGDETERDGVVASADTVGYSVQIQIFAGPQRTIEVTFDATEYLELAEADLEAFCRSIPGVDAVVVTDGCQLTVKAGAAVMYSRQLAVTALDTAGQPQTGQRPTVSVGIAGSEPFMAADGAPVTVVSAPTADLMLMPHRLSPSTFEDTYTYVNPGQGSFDLVVRGLIRPGSSPVKGISTLGPWTATVDVSGFPVGTTWEYNGTPVTETGGNLSLSGSGGGNLAFTMPGGTWPVQEDGTTVTYPASITVDATSFQAGTYLNNGTGTQPGDGLTRFQTTQNTTIGSLAGRPYPNNDHSAINVVRLDVPGVGQFSKTVKVPYTPGKGIFEPERMFWDQATSEVTSLRTNPMRVAQGAQLRADLGVLTNRLIGAGDTIVLGDEWDPALEHPDSGRPVEILAPDGTAVDPSQFTIQWSTTATGEPIGDASVTDGWVTQDDPVAGARAFRVLLTGLPVDQEPGAGMFTARLWFEVATGLTEGVDGPTVQDTLWGAFGASNVVSTEGAVLVTWPVPATTRVDHVTNVTTVDPGATVAYNAVPRVLNPLSPSQPFVPTVTVTLDRCATNPVNLSTRWVMQVIPGMAADGRICGSATSTPTTLVFTPAGGSITADDWNEDTQTASLPLLRYQVTATLTATNTLTSNAHLVVDGIAQDSSDEVDLAVGALGSAIVDITADPPRQDVDEPLGWRVVLIANTAIDADASTVVMLPRDGDGGAGYPATVIPPGATSSSFGGTYALTAAALDPEQTTAGATLWFTTDAAPSFEPGEGNWALVDPDDLPADATALKVVLPAGFIDKSAILDVTLTPTGNAVGDVYLLWAGRTVAGAGTGAEAELLTPPSPAQADIVASTISGIVWWDENNNSGRDAGEPTLAGVTVELLRGGTPVAAIVTDSSGGYSFAGLHSGSYTVRIADGGPNLPDSMPNYYGGDSPVVPTYSYLNRNGTLASLASTQVTVPVGGAVNRVDWGFYAAQPKVDVDKRVDTQVCDGSTCELSWFVTVTNQGNTDIDAGMLVDTASSAVYDVQALGGEYGVPVKAVYDRDPLTAGANGGAYLLTTTGQVYAWGSGAKAGNGNGSLDNNVSAQLVQGLEGENVVELVPRDPDGAFAITDDGEVFAWGPEGNAVTANYPNGDGSNDANLTAERVQGLPADDPVVTVVARAAVAPGGYALTASGRVYVWGGPIGTAFAASQTAPFPTATLVPGLEDVVVTDVQQRDGRGGYALTADGRVFSWGNGISGANGNGSGTAALEAAPVLKEDSPGGPQSELTGITRMWSRSISTIQGGYALDAQGRVWSWGTGTGYLNGDGATTSNLVAALVQGLSGVTVTELVMKDRQGALVITSDGQVFAWGDQGNGNGTTTLQNTTARVVAGLDDIEIVKVVPLGGNNVRSAVVAISSDGRVFGWGPREMVGTNNNGAVLPQNTAQPVDFITPSKTGAPAGKAVVDVVDRYGNGGGGGFAITADGSVYAWGYAGGTGAFGHGIPGGGTLLQAQQVSDANGDPLSGVVDVAARGVFNGYAVTSSNDVYAWGLNVTTPDLVGQLGDGDGSTGTAARLVDGLQGDVDDVNLAVASESTVGDLTQRQYDIGRLPAGGSLTFRFTGTVNQGDASFRVLNQAWFTSATTPIEGLLPGTQNIPDPPADPGPGPNPLGIPGNTTCNTDADLPGGQSVADSCDQVPFEILAADVPPGSVSGIVWHDQNRDGVRDADEPPVAGATVALVRGGVTYGRVTTGADGQYAFANLPPAGDYTVQFGLLGAQAPEGKSFWFTLTDAGSDDAADSDADQSTGLTAPFDVFSGTETIGVDAGALDYAVALTVDKHLDGVADGANAEAIELEVSDGDAHEVSFTVTNTGSETLTGITWTDTNLAGPAVTGWVCDTGSLGAGIDGGFTVDGSLAVDASMTCTGTLAGLAYDTTHTDRIEVTAYGADTLVSVGGADTLTVRRPEEPGRAALTVDKFLGDVPDGVATTVELDLDDSRPHPVSVRFTNTGEQVLTGIIWTDTTVTGSAVDGWVCDVGDLSVAAGGGFSLSGSLAAGDSVSCAGTLEGLVSDASHADRVNVTARGADNSAIAEGSDTLTVHRPPRPGEPGQPGGPGADGENAGPEVESGGAFAVRAEYLWLFAVWITVILSAAGGLVVWRIRVRAREGRRAMREG